MIILCLRTRKNHEFESGGDRPTCKEVDGRYSGFGNSLCVSGSGLGMRGRRGADARCLGDSAGRNRTTALSGIFYGAVNANIM